MNAAASLLALASAITWGVADFSGGLASRRLPTIAVTVISQAAGFAADGAYWIDPNSGAWITSTYYRDVLPQWVRYFNRSRPGKYWDREWKDKQNQLLASTAHRKAKDGSEAGFYEVIGSTAFANEYEFEFAKQLMLYENVGRGPATDLLSISLSANDIVGHRVGPDSREMHQMALDLDAHLPPSFYIEPPAFHLHAWFPGDTFGSVVTHSVPIGSFDGPYPFRGDDGKLL